MSRRITEIEKILEINNLSIKTGRSQSIMTQNDNNNTVTPQNNTNTATLGGFLTTNINKMGDTEDATKHLGVIKSPSSRLSNLPKKNASLTKRGEQESALNELSVDFRGKEWPTEIENKIDKLQKAIKQINSKIEMLKLQQQ